MTLSTSFRLRQTFAAFIALSAAGAAIAQTPAKLDPPVKPVVTGKFTGNGKNAAIKFVTVNAREAFSGKEAIELIFSEKDPAASKRPSIDAMFGKLGSALTLSVHHDGGLFGCEVSHSAHSKRGFSSLGKIKMVEFKLEGGNVSGRVSTGNEVDTFGEKWEVDLTFAAPLPEKLRNAPTPAPTPAPKPVASEDADQPAKAEPKAATGPLISARKLPFPKDAANVEFKTLVKHIQFSSPSPVDAVAKEFSANLKQQGWKDGVGGVMGRHNAILKREQGDAKLTIMIHPAATGSSVKIFTEGLDWTDVSDAAPSASKKSSTTPTIEDIEAEADKALKDALNGLPKGL